MRPPDLCARCLRPLSKKSLLAPPRMCSDCLRDEVAAEAAGYFCDDEAPHKRRKKRP